CLFYKWIIFLLFYIAFTTGANLTGDICFINYSLALFMNCWRFVLKLVLAHQKQQNKCAFSWRPALLLHFLMFNENLQILFLIDERELIDHDNISALNYQQGAPFKFHTAVFNFHLIL
ncbi:hypothetical protein ACJX0J_033627, partial [Zea mays]